MELNYITYQGIPSNTAHGIHTFSLIKYFVKNGIDIKLIFPLREKNATADLKILQNHYEIEEDFKVKVKEAKAKAEKKKRQAWAKANRVKKTPGHTRHDEFNRKVLNLLNKASSMGMNLHDVIGQLESQLD